MKYLDEVCHDLDCWMFWWSGQVIGLIHPKATYKWDVSASCVVELKQQQNKHWSRKPIQISVNQKRVVTKT